MSELKRKVRMNNRPRTSRSSVIILVIVSAVFATSVYVGLRLFMHSRSAPRDSAASSESHAKYLLEPGDAAPMLLGHTLDGKPFAFRFDESDGPTVLYTVSATCDWCARNAGNIAAIIKASDDRFRFIVANLSVGWEPTYLEPMQEELRDRTVVFLADVLSSSRTALYLGGTPETIVIDEHGKVQRVWLGAYTEDMQADVQALFGVVLPGLSGAEDGASRVRCFDTSTPPKSFSVGAVMTIDGRRVECFPSGRFEPATR